MSTDPRSFSPEEDLITETFIRASGPGGQNVNKVSTAVQLRYDAAASALPLSVKKRLAVLAGKKMTADGILVIDARQHRTQDKNRAEARRRLADLIARAMIRPRRRIATRPTQASRRRRLENKRKRSETKRMRRRPDAGDA